MLPQIKKQLTNVYEDYFEWAYGCAGIPFTPKQSVRIYIELIQILVHESLPRLWHL